MQKFPLSYQTQKMKTAMIVFLIFGILFPFIGAGLCADSFAPIPTPVDIDTVSPKELEIDSIYKFDELYVADIYAEYTENERFTNRVLEVEKQYYLCMLLTEDAIYTLSIETKPTDDIMPAINAYMNDDEQYLGDLAISGYFKADTLSGDLLQFYNEAIALYAEYDLGETPVAINLVYECNSDTDYVAYATEQQNQLRIVSFVFFGLGILCLVLSFFSRRSYKKQLAAETEKARAWTNEEE